MKSRQAKDMQETFRSIIEAMGGTYKRRTPIDGPNAFGIEAGGKIIHEVGTARMGDDPKTSVLNGYCQAHDVKNLFVTDGAPLVTNPDKNPNANNHGAFVARIGLFAARSEEREFVMSGQGVTRRDVLRTLAAGAVGGSVLQVIPAKAAEYAHQMVHKEKAAAPAGKYTPKFFDAHQYEALRSLCDTILPKDEKSPGRSKRGRRSSLIC